MIIQNNTAERKYLGWRGKMGLWLAAGDTVEVADEIALNSSFIADKASGKVIIVSYDSTPLSYVVQAELPFVPVINCKNGTTAIGNGDETLTVTFAVPFTLATYTVQAEIINTTDATPEIITFVVVAKTVSSFTVNLSGITPTANYELSWRAEVV